MHAMLINDFSEFCDEFYAIKIVLCRTGSKTQHLRGVVFRKDTDEMVGLAQVWSESIEEAYVLLKEKLSPVMQKLPRPPYEWEKVRVRRILIDYQEHKDNEIRARMEIEKELTSNKLTEEGLRKALFSICDLVQMQTTDLIRKIELLSEEEKQELIVSSEESYISTLSSENIDDLYLRYEIYKYILNPSELLTELHNKHYSKMISSFSVK